jgi:hypothetical protein
MKTALYGRIVFGASAALFGVIALMWYDSDTWQTLRQIWSLPFGTIIGGCLMIVQIAGGIGMQYPRTARSASIVLFIIICFSPWPASLASLPHRPSMCITGASSNSFPYSVERLPCTRQPRQMQNGRSYSAEWRALDSGSAQLHLR